ncbi:hypothetical protein GCM10027176_04940 [Actinoallomurus bryophytorum]
MRIPIFGSHQHDTAGAITGLEEFPFDTVRITSGELRSDTKMGEAICGPRISRHCGTACQYVIHCQCAFVTIVFEAQRIDMWQQTTDIGSAARNASRHSLQCGLNFRTAFL